MASLGAQTVVKPKTTSVADQHFLNATARIGPSLATGT